MDAVNTVVMEVEEELDSSQVLLIVKHLANEGFIVTVKSIDPLVMELTLPPLTEYGPV